MFIYIDESGSFAFPRHGRNNIACVGALTIPEAKHSTFEIRFGELKARWGCENSEVKGSSLSELQVGEFLNAMLTLDVKFHVCATDTSLSPRALVITDQRLQARQLLAHLTDAHQQSLVAQLNEVSRQLKALSPQLYMQFCLMNELLDRHIRDVVIHFALSQPSELGRFRWVIDAKEQKRTSLEILWDLLLPAFLQDRSLKKGPLIQIQEGDYSHFERFYMTLEKWPKHIPRPATTSEGPVDTIDARKIVRDSFEICSSVERLGLQAADICVNAFRRALMGSLKSTSWTVLGQFMLKHGENPVGFYFIRPDKSQRPPAIPSKFIAPLLVFGMQAKDLV